LKPESCTLPTILSVIALAVLVAADVSGSEHKMTATGEYRYTAAKSEVDACSLAVQRAVKSSIERACGSSFAGGASQFRSEEVDELSLFSFEMVGGHVVGEPELVSQDVRLVATGKTSNERVSECSVTARVEVRCDHGKRDPGFAPNFPNEVFLNRSAFREGDRMVISLTARSDMHISVLQFSPAQQAGQVVTLLYPNVFDRGALVTAGTAIRLPERSAPWEIFMALPHNSRKRTTEELMVLATRKPVAFPPQMTLAELHRIIAEIPLDDRREALFPYLITPADVKGEVLQGM
jgi:hypothetical protein